MPSPLLVDNVATSSIRGLLQRGGSIVLLILTIYAGVWVAFSGINPNSPNQLKEIESSRWISTSKSWVGRSVCRMTGVCGGVNWLLSTYMFSAPAISQPTNSKHSHRPDWIDPTFDPNQLSAGDIIKRSIPQYVLDHAPMLYLHANEQWWPTDVADFLHHVRYRRPGQDSYQDATLPVISKILANLEDSYHGFLEGEDDPETLPDWIVSAQNIPVKLPSHEDTINSKVPGVSLDQQGKQDETDAHLAHMHKSTAEASDQETMHTRAHLHPEQPQTDSGSDILRSAAPAFLVTVPKNNETLDAFWFFFYAFNRGARVAKIQYGNHIGDWEHILVRFRAGKPIETFLSAHEWGSAYEFDVLEKSVTDPRRPIVYAGLGSHAHYATAGRHAYALPFGLLGDDCGKGYLWDPTLNLLSFIYESVPAGKVGKPRFVASMRNPAVRPSWLQFRGRWGDRKIGLDDSRGRNYRFAGEYKYLDGPTGPWDKNLDRESVCEHPKIPCIVRDRRDGYVGPVNRAVRIGSYAS